MLNTGFNYSFKGVFCDDTGEVEVEVFGKAAENFVGMSAEYY
jgi:hypothetical protein